MDGVGGGVFGHQVVADACAAADLLGRVAVGAVWQCADAEVETALEAIDVAEARLSAARSALLAQADDRSLRERTGAPSTERWLADRFRWSRQEARRKLAVARAHGRQQVVRDALAAGAVTVEQAAVVAAGLDRVDQVPGASAADRAAAAEFLVGQAAALGPAELATAGRALAEALTRLPSADDPADEDAIGRENERAEREAQRRERNTLRVTRSRDGRLRLVSDLGPVGEAVARDWLRRAGQPLPGSDGFEDTREVDQRRGDALVDLLTGAVPQPLGRRVSPAAVLTVTVTLAELRAGLAGAGMLDTGATVSAATLRQLACGAAVVPAVMGGPSEVLDLGRSRRLFSPAQVRATVLRDRACVAPGCDRTPQQCQAHHSREWARGGPTDQDRAVLLCDYHHRMVHRQGWTVRLAANGFPELVPPTTIDPQQRPRQHHRYRLLTDQRLRR